MLLFKAHQFNTTDWAGGITTELFIYPEGAEYAERNFSFRLSTATVEIPTSNFTQLEGVTRSLMVLDGRMKLIHEGQHESDLRRFDVDEFDGGWNTKSEGTCVDFNLMCRKDAEGEVSGFSLRRKSYRQLELEGSLNFIYVFNGGIEVNGKEVFRQGLLKIKNPIVVDIKAIDDSQVAVVQMFDL